MRFLDSTFYWWLNRISSYLLLSGLWLLSSSLIVTLFPATAALFSVFRAWRDNPDDAFYIPFFARFREHFGQDFWHGLLWLLFAALLVLNTALLPLLPPAVRPFGFACVALAALLYLTASIFVFPLLASYSLGLWASTRAAVILGMTQLGTTALCALALLLVAVSFWLFPPSLLVSAAAAGNLVYYLCQRRLQHLLGDPV